MYNVAFVYTSTIKGYEGIIMWSSFSSKESFDKWYTEKIKNLQTVVEEGISKERCLELHRSTPKTCLIAAAEYEATNKRTGEVDKDLLRIKLECLATS